MIPVVEIFTDRIEDILPILPTGYFDACLCDPPYHFTSSASKGFMGQIWDGGDVAFRPETWAAVLRCLKPGASIMAFGAPKNRHRLVCAIEDAGAEIRDDVLWLFGSGFPKSLNIGKALDKREDAAPFKGYGTALKPAYEPCIWAMKPLDGTFAENALRHGVAGINIDAGRIPTAESLGGGDQSASTKIKTDGWDRPWMHDPVAKAAHANRVNANVERSEALGRWPANILHDGSPEVLEAFAAFGERGAFAPVRGSEPSIPAKGDVVYGFGSRVSAVHHADTGTAARFFYTAKAGRAERYFFCTVCAGAYPASQEAQHEHGLAGREHRVSHPTVKPRSLCAYLAGLLLPPKRADSAPRRLLVPFSGTGSEIIGALDAGWEEVIGIEVDGRYAVIARRRIDDRVPTTTVQYWSVDAPIPEGWVESVPASEMGHHGTYSRIIRQVPAEPAD